MAGYPAGLARLARLARLAGRRTAARLARLAGVTGLAGRRSAAGPTRPAGGRAVAGRTGLAGLDGRRTIAGRTRLARRRAVTYGAAFGAVARGGVLAEQGIEVGANPEPVHAAGYPGRFELHGPGRDPLVCGQRLVRR